MKKLAYFHGIVDINGEAKNHRHILAKLASNRRGGLRTHKLEGYNIWTAYCNEEDRILYTQYKYNGKTYNCILDLVLGHNYHKSPFIKNPDLLKLFLEANDTEIKKHITENNFVAIEDDTEDNDDDDEDDEDELEEFNLLRCHVYNEKIVLCDEQQQDIIENKPLPLIISGVPGSGKSFITTILITKYIEQAKDIENPWPIICVTQSQDLLDNLQSSLNEQPTVKDLPENAVQFKTYYQLLISLKPELTDFTLVDEKHCTKWLEQQCKTVNQQRKVNKDTSIEIADYDAAYQELRIISGCKSKAVYQNLGAKNIIFKDAQVQSFLYDAYTVYQEHLHSNRLLNPCFTALPRNNEYRRIFVDEAQDLSPLQLHGLFVNSAGEFCACENDGQSLDDDKSKDHYLSQLLNEFGYKDCFVPLQTSHRCPEPIIRMANAFSRAKSKVTGNGQMDINVIQDDNKTGGVLWMDEIAPAVLDELKRYAANGTLAIIAKEEDKKRISELFQATLVGTAKRFKGLEYESILMIAPLADPEFIKANTIYKERLEHTNDKNNNNKAKKGDGHEELGRIFNRAYTEVTRSKRDLYIYQPYKHNIDALYTSLKQVATTCPLPIGDKDASNSEDNWLRHLHTFLARGETDLALDIWTNRLKRSKSALDEYIKTFNKSKSNSITNNSNACSSSSSSNSKKRKSKTEKKKEFIDSILAAPSSEKYIDLFNRTSVDDYLFKTPVELSGSTVACLFDAIIINPAVRELFFATLSANIPKVPSLNSELLNKTCEGINDIFPSITLFSLLCAYQNGREVLTKYLEERKEILIEQDTLFSSSTVIHQQNICTSAFGFLSIDPKTHALLKTILTTKNIIISEQEYITHKILSKDCNRYLTPTPIFYLSRDLEGINVLKNILTANPKLQIDEFELGRTIRHQEKSDIPLATFQNTMAILESSEQGKEVLSLIRARKRPETNTINTISVEPKEKYNTVKSTSKTEDYINNLIDSLSEANLIRLFIHANVDKIMFQYPVRGKSCLFVYLFQIHRIHDLLSNLIHTYGSKLISLKKEHLLEFLDEPFHFITTKITILNLFAFVENGWSSLHSFLKDRKNIVLSAADILTPLHSRHSGTSFPMAFLMADNISGRTLFSLLQNTNPDFYIPAKELVSAYSVKDIPLGRYPTILYNLCSTIDGQVLLDINLMRDPTILITKEELFRFTKAPLFTDNRLNSFYHLTRQPFGLTLLKKIIARVPNMEITEDDLCMTLGCNILEASPSETPLLSLCKSAEGLELLRGFLHSNPNLVISEYNLNLRTNIPNKDNLEPHITSPQILLEETEEGKEILKIIQSRATKPFNLTPRTAQVRAAFFNENSNTSSEGQVQSIMTPII